MFDKIFAIEQRYNEVAQMLMQPEIVSDQETYKKLMKEHKSLTPLIEKYHEYCSAVESEKDALKILSDKTIDSDFKELAEEELSSARNLIATTSEELKILLLPSDPNDDRNVIVEIRGGAGGEEAALFAGVLTRMYSMYADSKGFKSEILSSNPTELGGYKEVSFIIEGEGAYSRFKFESGVHRVQRVPETEASGRIHTSTVTVAVLPEAEEVEVEINPADLKIDTFRSSGAGGQHINKTESAIRITHLPTGIVVECQDERSQFKNKDKAMKVLRSRLLERKQQEQQSAIAKSEAKRS